MATTYKQTPLTVSGITRTRGIGALTTGGGGGDPAASGSISLFDSGTDTGTDSATAASGTGGANTAKTNGGASAAFAPSDVARIFVKKHRLIEVTLMIILGMGIGL